MAILNYTTKINHYTTIAEIQEMLSKRGVQKIVIDNDQNGLPVGISFIVLWEVTPICYSLPCNFDGVLRAMQNNKKVPRSLCNREQALRVGWRIIKDWINAQMAIVDASVATIPEIFLPYAISKNGVTVHEFIRTNKNNLLLLP